MYHGERFNAYSHLAGSMLAVAALVLMTVKANGPYQLASALTYGICLILLYLGSTLYHSIPQPKIKAILQKVDHCMIYLLIAGSYTPFTLIPLKGGWGWSLFGLSWGLALFGIIQELTIGRKSEKRLLSMMIYVIMGWLPGCFGWRWVVFYTAQAFIGLLMIPKSNTDTASGTYSS